MDQRTKNLLALGLFLIFAGNSVVGWINGSINLTLVSTSLLTLIGLLVGVRPWDRNGNGNGKSRKNDEDEP